MSLSTERKAAYSSSGQPLQCSLYKQGGMTQRKRPSLEAIKAIMG